MRNYYESAVDIRGVKLKCATEAMAEVLPTLKPAAPQSGKKVAVVGGRPCRHCCRLLPGP